MTKNPNALCCHEFQDGTSLVEAIEVHRDRIRVFCRVAEDIRKWAPQAFRLAEKLDPNATPSLMGHDQKICYVDSDYGLKETLKMIDEWLPTEAKLQ
jgi:hypothetical protein